MARISIKDIAQRLNVSASTVSFVLNGKEKEMKISKEMAERVRKMAKELNYTPNMAARSLRTNKTKTIGLIVADISSPFFSKLARHIENIASKKKYQVIFGSSDESHEKFETLCDVFIGKGVDGMIVVPPQGGKCALQKLIDYKMPLVVVDREAEQLPINTVMMDNHEAAYLLTKHLIEEGAQNIGLIGHNRSFSNVVARHAGYVKALQEYKLTVDEEMTQFVALDKFEEQCEKALDILLHKNVDSILFATNKTGRQSLHLLKKRGIINQIKYASIDLFEECELSDITLSSIEQPLDVMSEKALTILFEQIENSKYKTIEYIRLYPPLIKRLEH